MTCTPTATGHSCDLLVVGAGVTSVDELFVIVVGTLPETKAIIIAPVSGDEGTPVTFDGSASTSAAGDLSFAWDFGDSTPIVSGDAATASIVTHVYADDGAVTVSLKVTDAPGASDTVTGEITINNVAPTITSVSATPASVNESSSTTVIFTAVDVAGDIPLIYFFDCDGNNIFEVGPQTGGNSTNCLFEDDSVHIINVNVQDRDGGVTTGSVAVTVNNVAPTITSVVADPSVLPSSGGTSTVTVNATDPGTGDIPDLLYSIDCTGDGDFVDVASGDVANQVGNSSTCPFPAVLTTIVHTVKVKVDDQDGGITTGSTTVTVDAVPPAPPALISPEDGARTNDTTPLFIWSASTSDDLASYRLQVTSGNINAGPYVIDKVLLHPTTSDQTTVPLAEGTYSWRVGAKDVAGNEAATVDLDVRTFEIDTTPPSPPALVLPLNNILLITRTVDFSWSPSVSADIDGYRLQVFSGDINTGLLVVNVELGAADLGVRRTLPADATYSWRVLGEDDVGNVTPTGNVEVRQFTLDTIPPTMPIGFQVASFNDRREVTLGWQRSTDPEPGTGADHYNVEVDQQVLGTVDDSACLGNLCQFTTPTVTPGEHTFGVNAVDTAGNRSLFTQLTARIVIPGDLNQDGIVSSDDLRIVVAAFGTSPPSDPRADADRNDVVDIWDLVLVAVNLGRGVP